MRDALAIERAATGERQGLDLRSWTRGADPFDLAALSSCVPPVLDVGCGPGRIATALAERGVPSLGIDSSPSAADAAARRGANVLCRSVFDPVPGEGRWGTVALFDGNIGIGGDPVRLLRRTRELHSSSGGTLVETAPLGAPSATDSVRLRTPDGESSDWFPWAWVGADDIAELASRAGYRTCRIDGVGRRWFARLGTGPV